MTSSQSAGFDPFQGVNVSAGPATGYGGDPHMGRAPSTGVGWAVSALVIGLVSIPLAFILIGGLGGILAIVLAIVALGKASKARRFHGASTGGTTVMSVLGIVASLIAIAIAGVLLWALMFTADSVAPCQHLIDDPDAFQRCVSEQLDERLGGQ